MDQIAEFGVAAHWKYKDPKSIKEKDTKEYKWMHDLVDLMNSSLNQDELIENSKINVSYTTGGVTLSATQFYFDNGGNSNTEAATTGDSERWSVSATFAF